MACGFDVLPSTEHNSARGVVNDWNKRRFFQGIPQMSEGGIQFRQLSESGENETGTGQGLQFYMQCRFKSCQVQIGQNTGQYAVKLCSTITLHLCNQEGKKIHLWL